MTDQYPSSVPPEQQPNPFPQGQPVNPQYPPMQGGAPTPNQPPPGAMNQPGFPPQGQPSPGWQPGAPQQPSGPSGVDVMGTLNALPAKAKMMLYISLGGALLAIIGTFGAWASISAGMLGTYSVTGIQGDGVFVLLLSLIGAGALIAGLFLKGNFVPHLPWVALGAAALSLLVCVIALANIANAGSTIGQNAIGWGLIVSTIGAIAMGVGAFLFKQAKA